MTVDIQNYLKQDCLLIWADHPRMHDNFRSRDKNGGHTIRFAIAENPMLHAKFDIIFIEPELLLIEGLNYSKGNFEYFVTLTLNR